MGKMCNFVPIFRETSKMLMHKFGIPFKIACSGEAARQFYNPLQYRDASLINAALDGKVPANVALIISQNT